MDFNQHLWQFNDGIAYLQKLENNQINTAEAKASPQFSKALLDYSAGRIVPAEKYLRQALDKAENIIAADPANRILAVTANNLVCALEEKNILNSEQMALMLLTARAARKYWQISGTWLETERAEYRLARSYLKAGDFISSIIHANLCLTICETNKADALEFFFAYEAITLVEQAMKQPLRSLPKMQKYFFELSQNDKIWCEKVLKIIEDPQKVQ